MPGSKSRIVRLDPDGAKKVLFDDNGTGPMFAYINAANIPEFIFTRLLVDGNGRNYNEVYGVSADGLETRLRVPGEAFAVDMARGLLVGTANYTEIIFTDLNTYKQTGLTLKDSQPLYYDRDSGVLYFVKYISNTDSFGGYLYSICAVTAAAGKETVLFSAKSNVIGYLMNDDGYYGDGWFEFENARMDGGKFYVTAVLYDGTGHMYNGHVQLEINTYGDKNNVKTELTEAEWFGIYKPFSYRGGDLFYDDIPGYYMFSDYSPNSAAQLIISPDDLAYVNLTDGIDFGEENFNTIQNIEYVDGDVFFTVATGKRNKDEDIGWRYGYNRGVSRVYRKALGTGKIVELYSY